MQQAGIDELQALPPALTDGTTLLGHPLGYDQPPASTPSPKLAAGPSP